jgi:hypothetical protein
MSEQSVIAVYDDLSKAEVAVMALDQNGFPMAQVSIVTSEPETELMVQGYKHLRKITKGGVAADALLDALVSKDDILEYKTQLQAGKYLVVFSDDAEDVERALDILKDTEAEEVNLQ